MRKLFLVVLLIGLSFQGSAELDSTISKNCPSSYEALISMPHPNVSYGNVGTPDMYQFKVCVTGISSSSIGITCRGNTGFYISGRSRQAHVSVIKGYNLHVCTGNMITEVKDSCGSEEIALFSISKRINTIGRHIAGLKDNYDLVLCGRYSIPENITVEMKFNLSGSDEAYYDDQKIEGSLYSTLAEYPYITLQGDGAVSGLVSPKFINVRRSLEKKNRISMKRKVRDNGVFVPLTRGTHEQIEDNQEAVLERKFLSKSRPNFGGYPSGDPIIRTILLRSEVDIDSNLTVSQGTHTIKLTKTGENEITITEE